MAAPTSGTGGEQDQFWPLPKFYFSVDIGDQTDLPFQEVSGLDIDTEVIEYRHGNSPVHSTIKMPGLMKYPSKRVCLRRIISFMIGYQKSA
jgi:phage tail-like protein